MTSPIEQYTIEDWGLICAYLMRKGGLLEARITLQELAEQVIRDPERRVLSMALEPGSLVLRLQTLEDAKALATDAGVEPSLYGSLSDELITKH